MASVGEIFTAPQQGLSVVVNVLPTTVDNGIQTLSQVVASPLTAGPAPAAAERVKPSRSNAFTPSAASQAASTFVALLADEQQSTTTGTTGTQGGSGSASAGSSGGAGGAGGSGAASGGGSSQGSATPNTHSSAANAYQATQSRGGAQGQQPLAVG